MEKLSEMITRLREKVVTKVSVIPCRLIGDLHERSNEIHTVPEWNLVNQQSV